MQRDEYKHIFNSDFLCELNKHHLLWDTHNCNIFHVLQFTLHISVIIKLQITLASVKTKELRESRLLMWPLKFLFCFFFTSLRFPHPSLPLPLIYLMILSLVSSNCHTRYISAFCHAIQFFRFMNIQPVT